MKQLWVVWLVVAVACGPRGPSPSTKRAQSKLARVLRIAIDRRDPVAATYAALGVTPVWKN